MMISKKIGSVRSCREYYVYLAAGFDALYYHYGQAAYAIPLLESDHIDNVNGMEYSGTGVLPDVGSSVAAQCVFGCGQDCSRNRSLRLPDILQKTVMTDFFSLHPRQNRKRWNRDEMPPMWHRADISTTIRGFRTMRRAARILRYQFGEPQIDEMTQEQLAVKNIIVQYCFLEKV